MPTPDEIAAAMAGAPVQQQFPPRQIMYPVSQMAVNADPATEQPLPTPPGKTMLIIGAPQNGEVMMFQMDNQFARRLARKMWVAAGGEAQHLGTDETVESGSAEPVLAEFEWTVCEACDGRGEFPDAPGVPCDACDGRGRVQLPL